jgi:rhamnose utilization protein RhaD (predicted bifunctional aldolase and dehydrogenase)/NAD(P)-dependent dehydrogenase (short-subunit alcohol dehydrogenase family)
MDNRWSDQAAQNTIKQYAEADINEACVNKDVALRVYTSRLLGNEPQLVLHGGGNTSVKTIATDITGEPLDVLCVKGSGWDLGDIEPAGLPAVRLDPLKKLVTLDSLSDEDMVNVQRCNLLDSSAPNPSVETLLHAFLPHKYVDHTHANAVLALTDQADGEAICREVFGDRVAYVPYIMPGFELAKKTWEIFQQFSNGDGGGDGVGECEGMIMLKHGIFTFAETAQLSYQRMIDLVTLAEQHLAKSPKIFFPAIKLPAQSASASDIAPVIRGLTATDRGEGKYQRMILDFRTSPEILNYVNGKEVERYSQQGTVTPDHSIRTKPKPLILPTADANDLKSFASKTKMALENYSHNYHDYFERQNNRLNHTRTELDRLPRVILAPGIGLFGLGASSKAAKIAADLAETTVDVISNAETIGQFESISEDQTFDMEYWSLEQAKLGKVNEPDFARQVVVVTGGASGIGLATALAFKEQGAEVAIFDLNASSVSEAAQQINGIGLACDVTNRQQLRVAFDSVCQTYGGVDILISNAGAAWQGRIGDVDDKTLRQSFELNFFAHQAASQEAVRIMRTQKTGGNLLYNTSKQAINPGADFGPYGLPKAATLFLMRQYALDHGRDGIRSNAVNADRIRSGLLTDDMITSRSKARKLSEHDYLAGNLLGREVTAEDVAQCFLALARADKTTGAVLTVDGGNIAAALR